MPTDPTAADMSFPSWASHTLTGLAAFVMTRFFDFVLAKRKLEGDQGGDLLTRCLARIDVLERRVDEMQQHLVAAAATNATLVQKVADLTADLAESRRQEGMLRAEMSALKGKL